jgi:hypothetical protein
MREPDNAVPYRAPRPLFGARQRCSVFIVLGTLVAAPGLARADEGGVSFWLPGLFGSFAEAPGQPGLSFSTFYYHPSVTAGGNKTFLQGGRFETGIQGRGDRVLDAHVLSRVTLCRSPRGRNDGLAGTQKCWVRRSQAWPQTLSRSSSKISVGSASAVPQARSSISRSSWSGPQPA